MEYKHAQKKASDKVGGMWFYGEQKDPAYRRKNGNKTRKQARNDSSSNKIVNRNTRRILKRDLQKRNKSTINEVRLGKNYGSSRE